MGMFNKQSFYNQAIKFEISDAYDIENLSPKQLLIKIEQQIKIRIKITAFEAFKLGFLFQQAKRACRLEGIQFKAWVIEKFNVSYETANNYINIYKNCLGQVSVAVNVPLSILIKLSAPNFPEALREWLFVEADLEKMNCAELSDLKADFLTGGFGAIQERVEAWNKDYHIHRQAHYIHDKCRCFHNDLDNYIEQIRNNYGLGGKSHPDKEKLLPEAMQIIERLYNAMREASVVIGMALEESEDSLFHQRCMLTDALKV